MFSVNIGQLTARIKRTDAIKRNLKLINTMHFIGKEHENGKKKT